MRRFPRRESLLAAARLPRRTTSPFLISGACESLLAGARLPRRGVLGGAAIAAGLAVVLRPFGRPGPLLGGPPAALAATGAPGREPDWDVPGGHFYTQGAPDDAPLDSGYVVSDAGGAHFWRGYLDLGGPAQLGYPVSAQYEADGVRYQAMQAGLLAWGAAAGRAEISPVFAALAALNLDGWLQAQGIPRTAPGLAENPALPVETRLAWLTHPTLSAAYLVAGESGSIRRFGLPMGEPERFGPYLAQRFEKAVLQLWLDDVPGQPPAGTVGLVQVGDVLKAAGLIPETAREPVPPPAPRPAVEAPPDRGAATGSAGPAAPAAPAAPASGGKLVRVALSRQWWYAYQDGQLLNSGPVTTGRPELPTPAGSFRVLSRHSPFVFVSPWPRGSTFWYETSPCNYALRITGNGVYLHDAPWRPFYGPGTNAPHVGPDGVWRTGSHGCINMPYAAAQWLYGWAPVGTPVEVSV